MKALTRNCALGLLAGFVGTLLLPICSPLEEDLGLSMLFKLRGKRAVPPGVCMVRMDRATSRALSVHDDPSSWPRSVHARLLSNLEQFNPAVVVFDVYFGEARSESEDTALEKALAAASNVVLCAFSDLERIDMGQGKSALVERVSPPLDRFARQAAATAPFPLPKVPMRVSRFWTFRDDAGHLPSLPVAALLCYLRTHDPEGWKRFAIPLQPGLTDTKGRDLTESLSALSAKKRGNLLDRQSPADNTPSAAGTGAAPDWESPSSWLSDLHAGADMLLLNFYGPQSTIPTISYHCAMGLEPSATTNLARMFAGKAVFIGLADPDAPTRKDGFNTVFSEGNGQSLSGTEIAATAFANLLDGSVLRTTPALAAVVLSLAWGFLLGALCRALPTAASAGVALIGSLVYGAAAVAVFSRSFVWLPVVVPAIFQPIVAFVAALLDRSAVAARERRRMHATASLYLPNAVVSRLTDSARDMGGDQRVVHATCVITDATNYTPLSEAMPPQELGRFMNRYFEKAFRPVRDQGGLVMNLTGDSILAVWLTKSPDEGPSPRACTAALELVASIQEFNREASAGSLPTRIGIHYGPILLGSMGALDHFEYVPIGDTVNTAARLEALNKQLKTEVLVSEDAIGSASGFFTRRMGAFRFAGKSRPLEVFELMCRDQAATITLRSIRDRFEDGIALLKAGDWQQAAGRFQGVLDEKPGDGASKFFLDLCLAYADRPPASWAGVVVVGKE
jgi:adenylate cyclase